MKRIIIEVDDDTADHLDRLAPKRSKQRAELIRRALRTALWEEEELRTREAYLNTPDSVEAQRSKVRLSSDE